MTMTRVSWEEFGRTGLWWLINRTLHVFGFAIVMEENPAGVVTDVYPARVDCRGFDYKDEDEGFRKVADYMAANAEQLKKEVYDGLEAS